MDNAPRKRLYARLLVRILIISGCGYFVVNWLPTLFWLLAPFIAAYLLAALLNPLVMLLNRRLHCPRRFAAGLLVLIVALILVELMARISYTVAREAVALARNYPAIWDSVIGALDLLMEKLRWINDFLPSDTEVIVADITNGIYNWLQTASREFANFALSKTAALTTRIGSGIIVVAIFLLAAYFITAEYHKISAWLRALVGGRNYGRAMQARNVLKNMLGGYLRAQVLLAFMAFVVMFSALMLYGQDYAFLIAIFLAFLDFLPIVGTTSVLVPWGVLELASGDISKGAFLLLLAGCYFVFRRIVEPKVLGSQIGLHPLIALISIFVGLKVYGVWGAIFGPVFAMLFLSLLTSGIFDNTMKDVKDVARDIALFLRRDEDVTP